ncbi:hypothetical protein NHX12_005640 [Muraenolepis orangiensis]|uniref:MADF domain-containing protein n=1 Tax=Muraenolepis orangiensis TaxID=630683 RepID=A0A9Q0ICE1_9TELE|nr:hypothetical protein NHX12_005640 [Muraenolepis orangiensis]
MASSTRCKTSRSMVRTLTTNYEYYSEMEQRLIEAIHTFPELYDFGLINYKNGQHKELAWRKISEYVCVPVAVCRRRWKGLRDTYIRECRREIGAVKNGSGATPAGSRKKWKYADDMAFLYPFIKTTLEQHTENCTIEEEYHGNTEHVLLEDNRRSSISCVEQPPEMDVKTEDIEFEPQREMTVDYGRVNGVQGLSEPTVKQNSADLFCRSLVPHLETLPLEKLIKVQIQILQIIQDATGS